MSGSVHFSPLFSHHPKFTPTLFEDCSRIVRRPFEKKCTSFPLYYPKMDLPSNNPRTKVEASCKPHLPSPFTWPHIWFEIRSVVYSVKGVLFGSTLKTFPNNTPLVLELFQSFTLTSSKSQYTPPKLHPLLRNQNPTSSINLNPSR